MMKKKIALKEKKKGGESKLPLCWSLVMAPTHPKVTKEKKEKKKTKELKLPLCWNHWYPKATKHKK